MKTRAEMEALLATFPQYRHLLYRRGYLITDAPNLDLDQYPFFGHWSTSQFGTLNGRAVVIHHHEDRPVHTREEGQIRIALIGHAYNPVTMESDEQQLLIRLVNAWHQGRTHFLNEVSDLTGIHLIAVMAADQLLAVQDCGGMMSCYFGHVDGDFFITSHPQLVGDLQGLERDPYVARLVTNRQYNIGNRYLPGNSSPYDQLKRLGANTYLSHTADRFALQRFFPAKQRIEVSTQSEISNVVHQSADILHRNIDLATQKWSRPAISLTGGTDSKTTLACAKGLYDRFSYFSFYSKPSEEVDANAAHTICDALGLSHVIHAIPSSNEEVEDFAVLKAIVDHNTSYFVNLADHEVRKMIYLMRLSDFNIELKSWISEIVRVFLERKYGIRMLKPLTPRHLGIFQTRYFGSPSLLGESDHRYQGFMEETQFEGSMNGYEQADLFYWELRFASWGASIVTAFDFCHEVTMPFNNRHLIELLLSLPRNLRKTDEAHRMMMAVYESRIPDLNLEVHNPYLHSYRIWLEKVYYLYRTAFLRLRRK